MSLNKAKKISVVGNSGAGKSILSHTLGKLLGLEVFSIDKIYWFPGWNLRDNVSFRNLHDEWLGLDSWIIEGVGCWEAMERRIAESDIVIFLDTSVALCKQRAETRIKEEALAPNSNITTACVYGDVKERQMEVIDKFHKELRPKLMNNLSELNPEKVRVIRSFEDLNMGNKT